LGRNSQRIVEFHVILWNSELFTDNTEFHRKYHGREIVN